jgi:tripartite-type tricarboxylate transporter receptor subunit TctC
MPVRAKRNVLFASILMAGLGGFSVSGVAADTASWPTKPMRMIVTYPPGGGADLVARLAAAKMTASLGRQVIVENRPGAAGQIGATMVARSAPDGYTMLLDATGFSINPALYPNLPYDTLKDFAPVSLLVRFPNVLVKSATFAPKNVKEVIAAARQNPGHITFASSGTGSVQHLAGAMFASKMKLNIVHVPYKGGGPALTDMAGGQVQIMFANGASVLPFVAGGKVIALATTGAHRSPALPNVPTMAEEGIPGMEVYEWNGIFLPAHTPPAIVEKLSAAARAAVNDPDVHKRLIDIGGEPLGESPAETRKFVAAQVANWKAVVKENHIKVD